MSRSPDLFLIRLNDAPIKPRRPRLSATIADSVQLARMMMEAVRRGDDRF
jgi:hypothetical protein